MSTPTTLYRFYDASGRLLYIGIAGNPGRRFNEHCKDKAWWTQVARSTMEHHATREAAAAAEVAAIIAEHPLYNVAHNTRGARPVGVQWICLGCSRPVGNGDGYIEVDPPKLCTHRHGGEPRVMTGGEFLALPDDYWSPCAECVAAESRMWKAWHRACDPRPDSDSYWIAVERFRTRSDIDAWDRHLEEKDWIWRTNWSCVLGRLNGIDPTPRDHLCWPCNRLKSKCSAHQITPLGARRTPVDNRGKSL